MSQIELVIFDCDGVLVDSERLAVRIDAIMLAKLGWPLTEDEIVERFVGRSDAYMQSEIERQLGRRLTDGWQEEFRPLYRQTFEDELVAVDGIGEALEGIPLPKCVASSSSQGSVRWKLELTELIEHFDGTIFSSSQVANGKPAPDLFLYTAQQMGYEPANCVVIEDSRWGVEAARAAGMHAFAYAGGLTSADRLDGPDTTVFHHMQELPSLISDSSQLGSLE